MQITNEILLSFIHCPYKAYRKNKSENGEISDFEKLSIKLKNSQKTLFTEKLSSEKKLIENQPIASNFTFTINGVVIGQQFSDSNALLILDGIEILGKDKIIPILLIPFEKASKVDKLFVSLQSAYLQNEFHFQIEHCKIDYSGPM